MSRPAPGDAASLEERLRQLEERFQSFIDSENEAVFCYELDEPVPIDLPAADQARAFVDARLVVCNDLYARRRGAVRPGELYGRPMSELAQESLARIQQLIVQLIEEGGSRVVGEEVQQVQADGSVRWARSKAHLVVDEGKVVRLWGILRDVTEQKRAEEERAALEAQLAQSQKMEAVGQLAGGVAHDFNNLLLVITSCVNLARQTLESDPEAAIQALSQVDGAARRATELTRSLLDFSRDDRPELRPLAVNDFARDLTGMLRRLLPARIALDFVPAPHELVVRADRSQLEQLFVNLCLNAVDAIEDVGQIRISAREADLAADEVAGQPWALPGRYAQIDVADDGAGLPPGGSERIFEPFFTTKEPGRGTGLGLTIVYGIVKRLGGMVRAERVDGEGAEETVFHVLLPLVEDALLQRQPETPAAAEPVVGGRETILLVEDDDAVRAVVERSLREAGYRVLLARDGVEAVRVFDEHGDVALVLLDAVLPKLSGRSVFDHIAERRPRLPILVASGYSDGAFPKATFTDRRVALLPKPFSQEHLLKAVRDRLDGREG